MMANYKEIHLFLVAQAEQTVTMSLLHFFVKLLCPLYHNIRPKNVQKQLCFILWLKFYSGRFLLLIGNEEKDSRRLSVNGSWQENAPW